MSSRGSRSDDDTPIAFRARDDEYYRRTPNSSQNTPLSMKKRQDSYLQAIGALSPEEETTESKTRNWKVRQDSYQKAIDLSPEELTHEGINRRMTKASRQDSYLQAIGTGVVTVEDRKSGWSKRQDSYQRAMEEEEMLRQASPHIGERRLHRVDTESSEASEEGFGFSRHHRSNSFQTRGYEAVTEAFTESKKKKSRQNNAKEEVPQVK